MCAISLGGMSFRARNPNEPLWALSASSCVFIIFVHVIEQLNNIN